MPRYLLFSVWGFLFIGCSSIQPVSISETSHRYFKEIDRPGSVYAVLKNPEIGGAMLRLQELDEAARPVGDTLQVWVQHFNGRKRFADEARHADMIIACNRDLQPVFAQEKHVLQGSTGEIFVYMMRGGLLIVSDDRISFYEVLLALEQAQR